LPLEPLDAAPSAEHMLSMIIIDIDYIKKVNDTCGHQCGDFILQ